MTCSLRVPPRIPGPLDPEMYKWRHLIENFFCKPKEFKHSARRACKADRSFEAMIYLAAAVINSRRSPMGLKAGLSTFGFPFKLHPGTASSYGYSSL